MTSSSFTPTAWWLLVILLQLCFVSFVQAAVSPPAGLRVLSRLSLNGTTVELEWQPPRCPKDDQGQVVTDKVYQFWLNVLDVENNQTLLDGKVDGGSLISCTTQPIRSSASTANRNTRIRSSLDMLQKYKTYKVSVSTVDPQPEEIKSSERSVLVTPVESAKGSGQRQLYNSGLLSRYTRHNLTVLNSDDLSEQTPTEDALTSAVAAHDLNGDGIVDLVLTNYGRNNDLLIGSGSGSFMNVSSSNLPASSALESTGVAVIEAMSPTDLIITNRDGPNVLLTNDGSGLYTAVSNSIISEKDENSSAVILFDFNGDGLQDVFICNYNARNELFQTNKVGAEVEFVRKTNNMAVNGIDPCLGAVALDKDADGDLDLLILNEDEAVLLENDGQGNFFKNTELDYPEGSFWGSDSNSGSTGACVGDLYSSGKENIVLLFDGSPNLLFLQNAEGQFMAAPLSDSDNSKSTACQFLDLENDGDLDILITNYDEPNSIFVNSALDFVEILEGPLIADSSSSIGVLFFDSNGSGNKELLVLNDNGYNEIFLHSGVDPLKAFAVSEDEDAMKVTNMYSFDSNGNSFDDLYVLKKNEKNELYLNDGDGLLVKSEGAGDLTASAANSKFALISDFNGDNALDILVCNDNAENELLINNGGSFSKLESDVSERADSTVGAVQLDLNFDGLDDLFVLNYEGKSEVLIGNGTGLFSRLSMGEALGNGEDIRNTDVIQAQKVITFDSNQNGLKDIFIITYWDDVPSSNLFYLNTGTGFELQASSATMSTSHKSSDVVAFDADGDGYDDLLVMNDGQPNEFYLNNREGDFDLVDLGFLSQDTVYKNVKIVDVNGDGLQDVLLWSFGLQQVLLMNEGDSFRQQPIMALNDQRTQTTGLAIGDFDGDEDPDIFLSMMGSPNELLLNCGQMYTSNRELYCLPAISRPKITSIQPSSILSQGSPVLFQGLLGDSDNFVIMIAGGELCKKSEQISSTRWICDIPARTSIEDLSPTLMSYGRMSLPASLPYAAPMISSFEPAFNWNNSTTFTITGTSLGSFQKVVRLVNENAEYDCINVKAIPGTSIHDSFTCQVSDPNFLSNQDVFHVNVSHDATESSKYSVSEGMMSTCRVVSQNSQACGCNPGYHYDKGQCIKCPADTFSTGMSCTMCPTGAYSVSGSTSIDACECPVHSSAQSGYCQCNAGYGGDATVKTKGCKACQIAGYKEVVGNEPCLLCPKGASIPFHIAAADSSNQCKCGEGSEFNSDSSECVCSVGHYGFGDESGCHSCPFGTFKDFAGNAEECSECSGVLGEGATTENITSVSSDDCRCKYGRVRVGNECVLCPKGADCSQTQLQSVEALPGFWRNVANSTSWLECEQPIGLNLCEGKATGINASTTDGSSRSSSVCREGHTGNLCNSCEEGYGKHLGICSKCATIYLPILTAVLAFVFLLMVLYLLTAEALRRIHFIIFPSSGLEVEYFTQSFLKIFVNWLQLSSLALYLKIPKSTAMEYMLELQGASFLSPWRFQTFNCLFEYDFYTRFYYTMLVPVAAIPVAVVISALVQHSGLVGRPVLRDMITMNGQILLLLTYAGVTHTIFQVFECRNIGLNEVVLYADPDVSCDTDEYKKAKLYGTLFVCFFSIGLPLYLTTRLWWLKSKLYERKTFIGYSFLFYNYKSATSIWYEGYCYARKLCIILVVTLIQDDTRRQIFLMGMLSVIFLGIHSYVKPYQNDALNELETQALLTLAFTYNVCVLFQEGSNENRKDFELIWIWFSILLNGAVSLLCLFKIFQSYASMGKLQKQAKKPAGLEDSLPESMHMTGTAKYNDKINGSTGFQDSFFPKDMTMYEDADASSSSGEDIGKGVGGDGDGEGEHTTNNPILHRQAMRPHSQSQAISNPLCQDI